MIQPFPLSRQLLEELFGIAVDVDEEELREDLCPKDLSEAMKRGLTNGAIDGVALPGGLSGGGELGDANSEMGMLGEALGELVNQNRVMAEGVGRADLRWRMGSRTGLKAITSYNKLKTRISALKKLIPKVNKASGWKI